MVGGAVRQRLTDPDGQRVAVTPARGATRRRDSANTGDRDHAQFAFGLLWAVLFTDPRMVGIEVVSARIGLAGAAAREKSIWRRHR